MLKQAPTLIVDKIEPTLSFMMDRLSFKKVMEVPGDNGLVFAMMVNGEVEIHLQTRSSLGDIPYLQNSASPPSSFIYIDVADVREMYEMLKDSDVLVPLEKTFYGATHFFVREPGGHVFGFSQNE